MSQLEFSKGKELLREKGRKGRGSSPMARDPKWRIARAPLLGVEKGKKREKLLHLQPRCTRGGRRKKKKKGGKKRAPFPSG